MNGNTPTKVIQVVKFKNGIAETLRGGPIDLSKLGKISVRRSSEILFDEEQQKYYIHFLEQDIPDYVNEHYRKVFFNTYEDAVKQEIIVINTWRKDGIFKLQ